MCSSGRAAAAALLAAALVVAGCGKKGDPEPPLRLIPRAAANLEVGQRGEELVLRFAYPTLATNGMALPGLAAVEVWQDVRPLAEPGEPPPLAAREFEGSAKLAVSLADEALSAAVRGDRLEVRLPLAAAGEPTQRTFGVRSVSSRGERSAFSNLAALVPLAPPPPPRGLALTPGEDGVEVSWEADGEGVGGYRVYRRDAAARSYEQPLASVGAEVGRHLDTSARFEQRYVYAVAAVAAASPRVESALAAEREIVYRDRFPPPSPDGLVALAEAARVRLSWRASAAADLAGYHVYRRRAPDGEPERLTSEPVAATTFIDDGLEPGVSFRYRVTAIDEGGNESPPSGEAGAAAR